MGSKSKHHYEPEIIAWWLDLALDGQSTVQIAKATEPRVGHTVGAQAVKNRLLETYPEMAERVFGVPAKDIVKAPSRVTRHEERAGIKEAGRGETWDLLLQHTPSLSHLKGIPFEEVLRATNK
jgi:hypothetical protein